MQKFLHRKESIILTAIDILDEYGVQGLSTKAITKRQGVTDAALFKHYSTKNELLLAIFDYYSAFDISIMEAIEVQQLSSRDGIYFFIKSFAEYYENYPSITALQWCYESFKNSIEVTAKIESIFKMRSDFITKLVEQGQKNGDIKGAVNPEDLSDVIIGAFNTITLKWRICKHEFPLKDRILCALDMILNAYYVKR